MEHEASGPEGSESEAVESGGLSRRDALKKGAMVGGAVMWAGPVVQSIGMSRASGQTATPVGTGISFIAFRFTCDGVTRFAKVEDITGGAPSQFTCEGPNSSTNCGVNDDNAQSGCGFFTLSNLVFSSTGELLSVRVNLTCTSGAFVSAAVTKCGFGNIGCNPATIGPGGNTATFNCVP